jgi:hypothetical protein
VEGSCEYGDEPSSSLKLLGISEWLQNWQLLRKGSAPYISKVSKYFLKHFNSCILAYLKTVYGLEVYVNIFAVRHLDGWITIDIFEKGVPLFSGYSDSPEIRIIISPSSLITEDALLSELSITIYHSCTPKMQASHSSQNSDNDLPDYTTSHSRRLSSIPTAETCNLPLYLPVLLYGDKI